MTTHDDILDLIAAVALDAATADEVARVEQHVQGCADCASELSSLRAAVGGLATAVPQLDPPMTVKQQVMDEIRGTASPRPATVPARRRRLPGFRLWPTLAGGFAALAIGLFAWNVSLRGTSENQNREAAVSATAQAPRAAGTATFLDDGSIVLRLRNLPPLAQGQQYELWTIRGGTPRSEGFASVTSTGDVVVATAELAGAEVLAITRERPTNTSAPTEQPLATVAL